MRRILNIVFCLFVGLQIVAGGVLCYHHHEADGSMCISAHTDDCDSDCPDHDGCALHIDDFCTIDKGSISACHVHHHYCCHLADHHHHHDHIITYDKPDTDIYFVPVIHPATYASDCIRRGPPCA